MPVVVFTAILTILSLSNATVPVGSFLYTWQLANCKKVAHLPSALKYIVANSSVTSISGEILTEGIFCKFRHAQSSTSLLSDFIPTTVHDFICPSVATVSPSVANLNLYVPGSIGEANVYLTPPNVEELADDQELLAMPG